MIKEGWTKAWRCQYINYIPVGRADSLVRQLYHYTNFGMMHDTLQKNSHYDCVMNHKKAIYTAL